MRTVWLSLVMIFAVIVGIVGGVLSWIGGMNPANAILAGGGAFAGTVVLLLAVIHFHTAP